MDFINYHTKKIGDTVYWYSDSYGWEKSVIESYIPIYENGQELPAFRMENGQTVLDEQCATQRDMRDTLNKELHKQKRNVADAEWGIVEAERHFKNETEKMDKLREIVSKFNKFTE